MRKHSTVGIEPRLSVFRGSIAEPNTECFEVTRPEEVVLMAPEDGLLDASKRAAE